MAAQPEQLALFGEEVAPAGGSRAPGPRHDRLSDRFGDPLPGRSALPAAAENLYQHPQASHRTVLNGQPVGYLLRRSVRKSIGFAISTAGLTVTAPRWATLSVVEAALQSKARWVLRKLQQFQQQQATPVAQVSWGDGAELAWRGTTVVVKVGVPQPVGLGSERVVLAADARTVWVNLPQSASPAQVRDAVQAWMQQQALAHFQERLAHFAPQLGVRWTQLRLSSARTRWGSAKADGSIRLHWRLMQFVPDVLDYVVVHELAHLRHMDHSPRFWQTVGQIVPDYAVLRARLRGERLPAW